MSDEVRSYRSLQRAIRMMCLEAEVERLQAAVESACGEAEMVGYYGVELDSAMQCFRETVEHLLAENANYDRHAQDRATKHARELERLRKALFLIAEGSGDEGSVRIARAALEPPT